MSEQPQESPRPEGPELKLSIEPELEPEREEHVSLTSAFGVSTPIRDTIQTILLAILLFAILNAATGRFQVLGTSMEPTLHDGQYLVVSRLIYWIHSPERGDIIVFHPPVPGAEDDYIKRIVGLPGEEIDIHDGQIWIDGALIEEPYTSNMPAVSSGTWVLEEDEYFVMGDNRSNSNDSRSWGILPAESIIGKAWLRYWPPEEWAVIAHYAFPVSVIQED